MVEYMPSDMKGKFFYTSLYRWNQCEKLEDTKVAIQKAADEAGISLVDAHELFLEISNSVQNTQGLANTGNRAIVSFFRVNWEKFAREAEKLLQAA